MESEPDGIRKKSDLWGGSNFIANQSHDKITMERGGEGAAGAVIEEEDLRDCGIHDASHLSLDLKPWTNCTAILPVCGRKP